MPAWSISNFVRTPLLVLAIVESLVIFSSVYVAALLRYGSLFAFEDAIGPLPFRATIVTAVVLTSMVSMGLYTLHQRIYLHEAAVRLLAGFVGGSIALAVIFYAAPSISLSKEMAFIAIVYSFMLLFLIRWYFLRTVDKNVFRRKTLLFGAGQRADSIADLRRRADRRGFKIVGKIRASGDLPSTNTGLLNTDDCTLSELARKLGADEIVVAMDDRRGNLPVRELLDCRFAGIEVIDLLEFLERETGKIRVDLVNPGWFIFSSGFKSSPVKQINKRIMDFLCSAVMLLLTWPLMLLIALAIKIEDGIRSPVFYKQLRVGLNNQNFFVLKYRSMCIDAESDGKAVWAAQDDDRITRVGHVLRKFRLDELPQIFNVLRGQMSLVGPRPERPEFVKSLKESIPYYSERHTVKPGVTGWAQLRYAYGANEDDAMEKLQYDLFYIKNQGLLLDLTILLQTVEVVLWGKGAR